jgi:hypothetical protein
MVDDYGISADLGKGEAGLCCQALQQDALARQPTAAS